MSTSPPPALPFELDAPLPAELAGRHQGWLTRYRRYPVFSRPWVRGRLRVLLPIVLLSWLALALPALVAGEPGQPVPLGAALQVAIGLTLPLWLGPWLAMRVRQRHWPEERERRGLLAAIVLPVLLMAAFHAWGAEPFKQWIAEQQGAVDASGKRKRVVMTLGLTVRGPDIPPAQDIPDPADPLTRLGSVVPLALLSLLLAGGAALPAWRRERSGMAELAREQELARAQAQRHEAEMRLSVLAAQVEPHFLFNTLAGVRSAIATDPPRASEMIDRLTDYLRAAIPRLRSDGEVHATLGAQLDIVRAYLGLMAARMPRLRWAVSAQPDLLQARCPPLMLISLAENAIKHGVERKVGPARVEVRAELESPGRLRLTVQDDGPGFQPAAGGGGLGLTNLRERLAQLYGQRASLTLQARPEGGLAAVLSLPLENDTVPD